MNHTDYQQLVIGLHKPNLTEFEELALGADYAIAEAGELANLVNKVRWQDHEFTDHMYEEARKELSDVMWGVAVAAHALGLTLEDLWNANAAKLLRRYPNGAFSATDSIARLDVELVEESAR
jgi:NTP pyrophosphatase (non-canonical NTP hydrolase)